MQNNVKFNVGDILYSNDAKLLFYVLKKENKNYYMVIAYGKKPYFGISKYSYTENYLNYLLDNHWILQRVK